jgi:hypothetical protein
MSDLRSRVRIEASCSALELLRGEIEAWFCEAKFGPQYTTQLAALQGILNDTLTGLDAGLGSLSLSAGAGWVYSQCRVLDRRLVWLRRIWEYFASRFDQRRMPRYAAVLTAADEVVWACYAEAAPRGSDGRPLKPIPLPYIEPEYSPRAFTRDDLPAELQGGPAGGGPASFNELLRGLPVPVVGLPVGSLAAPWWLAYLAHEAGHHVLADLKPHGQALKEFSNWLYDRSLESDQEAGVSPDKPSARQWFNWGDEVFADLFSVCCLGSAAVWAMAELETTEETGLLTPLPRYPAPAVRLGLMAAAAGALGVKDEGALGDLNPQELAAGAPLNNEAGDDLRASAREHLRRAALIAGRLKEPPAAPPAPPMLPDLPSLPRLAGFKAADFALRKSRLGKWTADLLGEAEIDAKRTRQETRLATAAAVLAWRRVSAYEDAKRREAAEALAGRIPSRLALTREEATRSAAEPPQVDISAHSQRVLDWLSNPAGGLNPG